MSTPPLPASQDPKNFIYGMTQIEFEEFESKCPMGHYDDTISAAMQQITGCRNMDDFRNCLTPEHPGLDPDRTMVQFSRIELGPNRNLVQFNAVLFDSKKELPWGVQVARRLDHTGRTVHSDLLKVHPGLRRRGLAVLVSFQHEQLWQVAGYKRIQMIAGKDAGRTFWALMGYDFGPSEFPKGKTPIYAALHRYVDEAVKLQKMAPELRDYIVNRLHDDDLRAWEVQLIADEDGKKIGVQAMAQSEWAGYKELRPDWPGNIIRDKTVKHRSG